MKKRIYAFALGVLYRVEAAIKDAQFRDQIRERNERNEWFVGAVLMLCMTLAPACGATATDSLRAEARAIGSRCADHATDLARAAPTHAEGVEVLIAERTRCEAEARAFCSEHELDCSELLP
jgi:hypothetical protein